MLAHEAAALAAHVAERKIEKSALDVSSHPIGKFGWGPFKCYVMLFSWKMDAHPPFCNAFFWEI